MDTPVATIALTLAAPIITGLFAYYWALIVGDLAVDSEHENWLSAIRSDIRTW